MSLPSGWVAAPLLEIAALHDNRRVPLNQTQRSAMPGSYPYYGANGQVDTVGDYLFDGDYILLAEDGGYFDNPRRGVAYRAGGKFWVNNHAHILKSEGEVLDSYLCPALNSLDWMEFVSGTTRLKLTQGGMQRVHVPIPPLPEQRRIVTKLDALTSRLARSRAEVSKTMDLQRRMKAAICEAAISIAADEQPLSDVLTDVRYGTAQKCGYNGSIPVLRIPNVARGEIDLSDMKSADFQPKEIAALSLAVGDILIVRSNGSLDLVGRSAVVNESAAGMLYAGYLIRLRLDPTKALPAFLQLWLSAPSTRAVIESLARSSSGVNNINSKQLQALRIRLPDLDTQKKRAEAAKAAFTRANRLEAEAKTTLALIDRLEAAILARAFRGELVPQDPNDEPASVLLERIRARRAAEPKAKHGRRPKQTS